MNFFVLRFVNVILVGMVVVVDFWKHSLGAHSNFTPWKPAYYLHLRSLEHVFEGLDLARGHQLHEVPCQILIVLIAEASDIIDDLARVVIHPKLPRTVDAGLDITGLHSLHLVHRTLFGGVWSSCRGAVTRGKPLMQLPDKGFVSLRGKYGLGRSGVSTKSAPSRECAHKRRNKPCHHPCGTSQAPKECPEDGLRSG